MAISDKSGKPARQSRQGSETGAPGGSAAPAAGLAAGLEGGRRPTLKTIAEIAGLGVTTVSRALKDGPEIGEDTKRRVREIARTVGYRPDRAGVRLRTGKTNVISLILNPHEEVLGYGSSMILGMSKALRRTGYHLVVTPHFLEGDPMEPIRYIVETGAADGIILSRTQPQDQRIRYLLELGFPFVSHGRTELASAHPYHDFDNYEFAFEAARRLTDLGRKRLSIVAPPDHVMFHTHMMMGLERAAHQFAAALVPIPGIDLDSPPDIIRQVVYDMACGPDAPDGFICGGDVSAMALVAGLIDAGLRPGKDADVVAKQTSPVLDQMRPVIDTFLEDLTKTGYELASLLLRSIAGEPAEHLQTIGKPEPCFRTRAGVSD